MKKASKKSSKGHGNDVMIPLKKKLDDNKWIEKQITSFTAWINYNFNKTVGADIAESEDEVKVESADEHVTSDVEAVRAFTRKRNEAKVRENAYNKFKDMRCSLVSVEHEITEGRIALREDRDVLADLGLQEAFMGLLFTYELSWLRLGLEIVFGEIITIPSSFKGSEQSQWMKVLKSFVVERFLSDPDIVNSRKKYTFHGTEDVTKTELGKHILKKFFSLVNRFSQT